MNIMSGGFSLNGQNHAETFRNERSCKDDPLLRLWKVKGAEGTPSNDNTWRGDNVI